MNSIAESLCPPLYNVWRFRHCNACA